MTQTTQLIPTARIHPSPFNPPGRTEDVGSLAASIVENGLLQAIVVRQHPTIPLDFEVILGNRRRAACEVAGVPEMEARVVEADDNLVRELQLIENLERSDLAPMDEAESLAQLKAVRGWTDDEVSRRLGRHLRLVQERLALLKLAPEIQAALREDEITLGTAAELTRLVAEDHLRVLQHLRDEAEMGHSWSLPDLRAWIRGNILLPLSSAPFDLADPKLPGGACTACPKNTDSQPALFPSEGSWDRGRCLDPVCFGRKVDGHWAGIREQASKSGARVLEAEEARAVLVGGMITPKSGLVDLQHYDPTTGRRWDDVLTKAQRKELAKSTVHVRTPDGRELVAVEKAALGRLKKLEAPSSAPAPKASTGSPAPGAAPAPAKKGEGKAAHLARMGAVARAAEGREVDPSFWLLLVDAALQAVGGNTWSMVAERRGARHANIHDARDAILAEANELATRPSSAGLRGLLAEILLCLDLHEANESHCAEILAYFDIDESALAEAATGRPKKKARRKKGATA